MDASAAAAGAPGSSGRGTVGLVLAAGEGRRLGLGAKALLRSAGQTLVERAVAALRGGGCAHVLVVVGAQAEEVAVAVEAAGAEVVRNEAWASGLASSFRAGVAALPEEAARVVVTLVDQPGIGASVVAHVLDRHRLGRIAAASYGGKSGRAGLGAGAPHPGPRARHPMVFDTGLGRDAAALAEGDRGAREFLRRRPDLLDLVDCSGLGSAADVDTPADLDLLEP